MEYKCESKYSKQDTNPEDLKVIYKLTNSKDNSYILKVYKEDDDTFKLVFSDFKNRYYSHSVLSKTDFFKAETIHLECNYWQDQDAEALYDKAKKVAENFQPFQKLSDTIINQKTYQQSISRRKYKEGVRNRESEITLLMEENTSFHLPIINSEVDYFFSNNNDIPRGIPKIEYIQATHNETYSKVELVSFHAYTKQVTINPNCEL